MRRGETLATITQEMEGRHGHGDEEEAGGGRSGIVHRIRDLVSPLDGKSCLHDGVKFLAEHAGNGAFWLIDEVVLNQSRPKVKAEDFQLWILTVHLEHKRGTLRCEDGNDRVVFSKAIPYTDFPLATVKLYYTDNTVLLPSEY
jgi:hypothetical protein